MESNEKGVSTNTLEKFYMKLEPLEFKLHISLIMEIQELLSRL